MPAIPLTQPRKFNDLYYFITVPYPKVMDFHEMINSDSDWDYHAYACNCYYLHLQNTFEYLALAAETDELNLDANKKTQLRALAQSGKKFIDVINEINYQTTFAGLLRLPRLTYKFNPQQAKQCLELFKTVNLILHTNRNMDLPENQNHFAALLTRLETQTRAFSTQFAPTAFDVLNVTVTALISAAITGVGLCVLATALIGVFVAPILITAGMPGGLFFLATAAISAALSIPVIEYGISSLLKSMLFFRNSQSIEYFSTEMRKVDTQETIRSTRYKLVENMQRNLGHDREEWDKREPIEDPNIVELRL